MEVGHAEAHAVGIPLLDVFAALHDRCTGADHVVEHDHVLAFDFFDADVGKFRIESHADFTFAGTDLVHHHALAFWQAQGFVDGVHEGACALVRRDNHQVVTVLAGLHKIAVLDVVGVDVRGNQIVEIILAENVGEKVLHLHAVVVHRHHGIHARGLEELGIQEAGESLSVKFLEVNIRAVLFQFAYAVGAAILGAVEQVRFNQDNLFGSVVLGGTGQNAVTHGVIVTAAFVVRDRANQDNLAFQATADMFHIVHVQTVAGAEFGVCKGLQGDHVGNIFTKTDVLGHVDGKGVVGEVTGHDKTIRHNYALMLKLMY